MNPNPAAGGGSCWTGEPYLCPDGCNTLLVPRETKGGPARDLDERVNNIDPPETDGLEERAAAALISFEKRSRMRDKHR
jgi:hypothetical protein